MSSKPYTAFPMEVTTTEGGVIVGPAMFRVIDLARLKQPIEPVRWAWDRRVPRKEVTLFSGHGGAGKSMLALMLALLAWSGRQAWGAATERCRAAFFSAEDSEDTVLRRTKFICSMLGIPDPEPDGGFYLLDAVASPELYIPARSGLPATTTFVYDRLRDYMATQRIELLVIDGASDTFTGDEIRRAEVRAYVRALAALAREFNAAIVLLAHVDKITAKGSKDGQSYSGSTQWHNSVRSRLYLSQPEVGRLVLEHQKSNHGPLADPMAFDWQDDDVPRLSLAAPETPAAPADDSLVVVESAQVRRVLQLIDEFTKRGEFVSTAYNSRTAAPSVLFRSTLGKAFPISDAVRAAHRAGYLAEAEFTRANRMTGERWSVTTIGRMFAGLPADPVLDAKPGSIE